MAKKRLTLKDSFDFRGTKVLVTGAASGIERAIAQRFAEAGASVLLLDRNQEGLSETSVV